MMFIRPIEKRDKQTLLALAKKTGSGFTSLPDNEQHIGQRPQAQCFVTKLTCQSCTVLGLNKVINQNGYDEMSEWR